MKKFISIFAVCLLIIPALCFTGCKNNRGAESVINRTYYVTKLMRDNQNVSASATNGNMRISFGNNYFKVEIGQEAVPAYYGFYTGTYSINDNDIALNIKTYGGIWSDAGTNSTKKDFVVKNLSYRKGNLFTEFISNNDILQYTFELPN